MKETTQIRMNKVVSRLIKSMDNQQLGKKAMMYNYMKRLYKENKIQAWELFLWITNYGPQDLISLFTSEDLAAAREQYAFLISNATTKLMDMSEKTLMGNALIYKSMVLNKLLRKMRREPWLVTPTNKLFLNVYYDEPIKEYERRTLTPSAKSYLISYLYEIGDSESVEVIL